MIPVFGSRLSALRLDEKMQACKTAATLARVQAGSGLVNPGEKPALAAA